MKPENIQNQLNKILEREDLTAEARSELSIAVSELRTPLDTDVWIYRIVVTFLGVIVFATVIGGIYISAIAKGDATVQLSEGIIAIGSASVGALAGLLAPSPSRN